MGTASVEETIQAVRAADDELAGIIDTLPYHLQPDADTASEEVQLHHVDTSESWVMWQRFDLTVVLLHLRVRVNRTLQDHWLSASNQHHPNWARSISVRSAVSIIWINNNWGQPASMRKQWYVYKCRMHLLVQPSHDGTKLDRALSHHIFTAALLLLREWQDSEGGQDQGHRDIIHSALELLDQVSSRNALAHQASLVLRERIYSIGLA